ncbi:hypothetical protein Bmyc01_20850 [Bacillus mycoides]|nr:hypothetical protein Bmyc01_20850 [Bacillus mycoides]
MKRTHLNIKITKKNGMIVNRKPIIEKLEYIYYHLAIYSLLSPTAKSFNFFKIKKEPIKR